MNKESRSDGAASDVADGTQETNQNNNDGGKKTVSYETFDKVMKKLKSTEARLEELDSKLAETESTKLAEQGKWKDLYEKSQKEISKLKDNSKELIKTFGRTNLENTFKMKLASEGCIDSDLALKAFDYSDCTFGDDFSVDSKYVEEKISGLVKGKPHLFKKEVTQTHDLDPTNNISSKSVNQMNTSELIKELIKSQG